VWRRDQNEDRRRKGHLFWSDAKGGNIQERDCVSGRSHWEGRETVALALRPFHWPFGRLDDIGCTSSEELEDGPPIWPTEKRLEKGETAAV